MCVKNNVIKHSCFIDVNLVSLANDMKDANGKTKMVQSNWSRGEGYVTLQTENWIVPKNRPVEISRSNCHVFSIAACVCNMLA